jgi:hypothetical protein
MYYHMISKQVNWQFSSPVREKILQLWHGTLLYILHPNSPSFLFWVFYIGDGLEIVYTVWILFPSISLKTEAATEIERHSTISELKAWMLEDVICFFLA